jgi:hypothetical protein
LPFYRYLLKQVGKVQEIEKIRNLIEKEASKEFPDKLS